MTTRNRHPETLRPRTRSNLRRSNTGEPDDKLEIPNLKEELDSSPLKDRNQKSPKKYTIIDPPLKKYINSPNGAVVINSSPIKRINTPDRCSPSNQVERFLNSSPSTTKKTVAFSDELISDIPSSPGNQLTPKKSILKSYNLNCTEPTHNPNDASLWVKEASDSEYGPANSKFWLQGTIVQLPSSSPDLPQLVAGCVYVLHNDNFKKRFEVYATLNNIYKSNNSETLLKLFTIPVGENVSPIKRHTPDSNYIIELAELIRRDIIILEEGIFDSQSTEDDERKNDPFTIRIINQALKLMNFLMLDQELNNFIPLDDVKWLYKHSCTMLSRPNVSKALVAPYLLIIKDCKFNAKKKRILFSNSEIPETMLQSLMNMKSFPSSSILTEKFICFKNFVINFPQVMAKHINHWFGMLVMNIVNLSAPFYAKCIGVGINTLLEVAKAYLDNRSVQLTIRDFLSTALPQQIRSLSSETSIDIDKHNEVLAIDFIIEKLDELINAEEYKSSLDIWIALTLLVGDAGTGFDKWVHLNKWLRVPKLCFNSQNLEARVISINSWRAVMYNLCHNDLDDLKKTVEPIMRQYNVKDRQLAVNNALKHKIKLVTHLFSNIESSESQKEVIDCLNNIFLSLLYNLLNPIAIKQNTKYLHIYWDKIIQPILVNFYFKKNTSNSYMNQLGIRILTKLLKNAMPVGERTFNDMRCLSNEPITLNEINSLPARWVYSKFDRIMHNVVIVFELEKINVDQKINFLNIFLNNLKPTTNKEMKVSDSTFDIIDNLPFVLDSLFKLNRLSFDMAYKLIINLKDTFEPSSLISGSTFDKPTSEEPSGRLNIYAKIIENCIPNLEPSQIRDIINMTFSLINDRKLLVLIHDVFKLNVRNDELHKLLSQALSNVYITKEKPELHMCGEICQLLNLDFEIFVKKVIQSVVSITNTEELKQNMECLRIQSWSLPVFKYFLILVHNAPNVHIQQFTIQSIAKRAEVTENFLELVRFLIESQYDLEILHLTEQILKESKNLIGFSNFEFQTLWKSYLKIKSDAKEFEVLDQLLSVTCKITDYDVVPYTFNIWKHLPLLKSVWKKDIPVHGWDGVLEGSMEVFVEQRENNVDSKVPSVTDEHARRPVESLNTEADINGSEKSEPEAQGRQHSSTTESPVTETHDIQDVVEPEPFENEATIVEEENAYLSSVDPDSTDLLLEVNSNEIIPDLVPSEEQNLSTPVKKISKRKGKSKKGRKKKSKTAETNQFDIHSFTAMLNAKLTTPEKVSISNGQDFDLKGTNIENDSLIDLSMAEKVKPKRRKLNTPEKVSDPKGREIDLKVINVENNLANDLTKQVRPKRRKLRRSSETQVEAQVPSSLDDDDISEIEVSYVSEMNDESVGTPTFGKRTVDYSKIMEGGFHDRKRRRAGDYIGATPKKLKLPNEKEDSLEEICSSGESYKNSASSILTFESTSFKEHSTAIRDRSLDMPLIKEAAIIREDDLIREDILEEDLVREALIEDGRIKDEEELNDVNEDINVKDSDGKDDCNEESVGSYPDEFDPNVSVESINPQLDEQPDTDTLPMDEEIIDRTVTSLPKDEEVTYRTVASLPTDEEATDRTAAALPTDQEVTERTVTTLPMVSSQEEAQSGKSRQLDLTPLPHSSFILERETSVVQSLHDTIQDIALLMATITNEDISRLSGQEKFELETEFMKFMLRMRSNEAPNSRV